MPKRILARILEEGIEFLRLCFLIGLTVLVAFGGYLVFEHYLLQTFQQMFHSLGAWWETLSLAGLWRNAVTWFMAMGRNWLLVEIPKRVAILYVVPTVILMFMPGRWISAAKRWLCRRKEGALRIKYWVMGHAETLFGKWAGVAVTTIVALAFFVVFYGFFSVYVVLWFGFIKLPGTVVYVFTMLWGTLVGFAQKLGFRKWAFKFTGWIGKLFMKWIWPAFVRFLPDFHWFKWLRRKLRLGRELTEEEKRKRQRRRVRWAIRRRYIHAEWLRRKKRFLARLAKWRKDERGSNEMAAKTPLERHPPASSQAAE